jgi:hypothetical protein
LHSPLTAHLARSTRAVIISRLYISWLFNVYPLPQTAPHLTQATPRNLLFCNTMSVSPLRAANRLLLLITLLFLGSFGPLGHLGNRAAAAQVPSTALPGAANSSRDADFTAAADEVLAQMSQITGLRLRTPLKKTLRSREEIHRYILREMDEDKLPAERYASARSAEAFGLLPRGFDFDNFMIELLTEQIAGLYDPKAHEFYIADWIPAEDQRMVMAHELTHAL